MDLTLQNPVRWRLLQHDNNLEVVGIQCRYNQILSIYLGVPDRQLPNCHFELQVIEHGGGPLLLCAPQLGENMANARRRADVVLRLRQFQRYNLNRFRFAILDGGAGGNMRVVRFVMRLMDGRRCVIEGWSSLAVVHGRRMKGVPRSIWEGVNGLGEGDWEFEYFCGACRQQDCVCAPPPPPPQEEVPPPPPPPQEEVPPPQPQQQGGEEGEQIPIQDWDGVFGSDDEIGGLDVGEMGLFGENPFGFD